MVSKGEEGGRDEVEMSKLAINRGWHVVTVRNILGSPFSKVLGKREKINDSILNVTT